jgi:CO/xanthine dehydrogenase FAD-binding subunit
MNNIKYFLPKTLEEAVKYLSENNDAKVLAGGTDLIVKWKKTGLPDMHLMDIRGIDNFGKIYELPGGLFIGAGATIEQIESCEKIKKCYPILSEAASKVASVQVRNLATVGGNSCNAAPSADTVLPLIVYGAEAVIISTSGERSCLLKDFFTGPGKTVMAPGEMLKGFMLPKPNAFTTASFAKHSRRAGMDLATVGVAVSLCVNKKEDKKAKDILIALGAVGPIPVFVKGLEKFDGADIFSDKIIEEIAELSCSQASPISDIRGSKDYRSKMIRQNVKDCICQALKTD